MSTAVALHGNSGSTAAFRKYQTAHFPDFHTFALNSRGHGQSVSQDDHLEYCQLAQDLIAFTPALSLAPCAPRTRRGDPNLSPRRGEIAAALAV